jgi:hypothetical protein
MNITILVFATQSHSYIINPTSLCFSIPLFVGPIYNPPTTSTILVITHHCTSLQVGGNLNNTIRYLQVPTLRLRGNFIQSVAITESVYMVIGGYIVLQEEIRECVSQGGNLERKKPVVSSRSPHCPIHECTHQVRLTSNPFRRLASDRLPFGAGWNRPISITSPVPICLRNCLLLRPHERIHRTHTILLRRAALHTS